MYGGIKGFTHEVGYNYTLQITEKKIANPPADGSSIERKLVKVLSKKPLQPNVQHMKGEWTIKELLVSNVMVSVQDLHYTLNVKDSSIQAKVCNSIRGKIQIAKDGTVKTGPLMSTKMACSNMAHENALMQALTKATQWEVKSGQLYMTDKTGKVFAILTQPTMEAMPTGPAHINYEAMLTDSRYTVTEIEDNRGITMLTGSGAFMQFNKTAGRINGNGGCNNFFGDATIQFTSNNAGTVRFSKLGSTMMACPNQLVDEHRIFKLLEQADAFEFAAGELQLKRGTQIIIRLKAM
jgi:heat shock protein HslJ